MPNFALIAACFSLLAFFASTSRGSDPQDQTRRRAEALDRDGKHSEAFDLYRGLILDPATPAVDAEADINAALAATDNLGRADLAETLLDDAYAARGKEWRVARAVAGALAFSLTHEGFIVDGAFRRGDGSRSGRAANVLERDRARAIAMMLAAETAMTAPGGAAADVEKARFYRDFAKIVAYSRDGGSSYLLTGLTTLDPLPAFEEGFSHWNRGGRFSGAPVNEDGSPLFFDLPASWRDAANDGERWRWLLGKTREYGDAGLRGEADWEYASFLHRRFGVQTMAAALPRRAGGGDAGESGPFAVRTLAEDETIARLASGVRRFTLPPQHAYIAILRRIAGESPPFAKRANTLLAKIFENRQQYVKAVQFWEKLAQDPTEKEAPKAIARITGNVGMLEAVPNQPAGTGAKLPFVFRNGSRVALTAYKLDEQAFLRDTMDYLRSGTLDPQRRLDPEAIGQIVAENGAKQYVLEKAAERTMALDPLPGHYSRRIFIDMPFDRAGAYLVTARMENGNLSRAIFWQSDLALVAKTVGDSRLHFVADAMTGMPADKARISFFGYKVDYGRDQGVSRPLVVTDRFSGEADADGLLLLPASRFDGMNWLTIAETGDKRLAYLGFSPVWVAGVDRDDGAEDILYALSDRPVYRPEQVVHYKAWLGRRSYGEDAPLDRRVDATVTVINPMGEHIGEKTVALDAFGGLADSFTLGKDATLGMYRIMVETPNRTGGVSFRVEEYKKPEFEVTVTLPDEGVKLGETIRATVAAAYYFGGPVADGTVKYTVTRTPHRVDPRPPAPWDWLYGRGYWWSAYDYDWAPGWSAWGVGRIAPGWFAPAPPEVVAEGEGGLDPDGTFRLTVDTALAKALYGDQDHEYAVTAEVTDRSRRTVVGAGSLVAARKPFSVTGWTDRGYYLAGQRITASFMAYTPQGKGLSARGEIVLHRLRHGADGTTREERIDSWTAETDADGKIDRAFTAAAPGQYRLSLAVKDAAGRGGEGAVVFTVRGDGEKSGDFRYAGLELVPDKREYRPGDAFNLAVNSENRNGVVLLFPRADQGGKGEANRPVVLRLDGGSRIHATKIGVDDQPNFFCEALTVFDGKLHSEVREIFVPPAAKTLTVDISPDKETYLPGDKATFSLRVTDANGKPMVGQCVVTLYDKSVEYISGGSNVEDIREAFWNWKRYYYPSVEASLNRRGFRVRVKDDVDWTPLGVFGRQEMDWNDDGEGAEDNAGGGLLAGKMMRSAMPETLAFAAAPMADMAMPAPAAAPAMEMATAGGAAREQAQVEPAVRREFADTAVWLPSLVTDADGEAVFEATMPDNLTTWKARVWSKTRGSKVGEASLEVVTRKNIIIRPQTPRFLTQKDLAILSANVHNYLPAAKTATVELVLEGGVLEAADGVVLTRSVDIPADGETRVDWLVRAPRPGAAVVRMRVLTDVESDAAEVEVPVIVHGARKVENLGGVMRPGQDRAVVHIDVPRDRLADRSRLAFSFSPTLATALLEAVPYLADYPYGCTEQTLNRFLPAVMAKNYLAKLGLTLADAAKQGEKSGDPASREWLARFGDARGRYRANPVFDQDKLDDMVKSGVERLVNMQNGDGGWGWFSGTLERSWPHTTAVVVHGLQAARDNGVTVFSGVIEAGLGWLRDRQESQIGQLKKHLETKGESGKKQADNLDAFVYMVLAREGYFNPDMRDFLYRDRLGLSLSGLAMFGLALEREGATNALEMVLANLEEFVERNRENHTAWLRMPAGQWWWWYNDEVETLAWYLKLLARVDPKGEDTAAVAKYLLQNRKNASYWRSTRDTAYAMESLIEYASAAGETTPGMTVAVYYDGKKVLERELTPENLLADNLFVLEGIAVEEGRHEIRVERTGGGTLYFTGSLDVFSLEDPIPAVGGDLTIKRSFHRLTREPGSATAVTAAGKAGGIRTESYRRELLPSPFSGAGSAAIRAGDLVEVELTVETANDYEYLVFEDMKAAGLEAVELTSGYDGNNLGAYVEYRDQKVVLFVRHLPRGVYNLSYRFRAETPGAFSALPAFGGGMYATDLFANSEEMKVRIEEGGVYE